MEKLLFPSFLLCVRFAHSRHMQILVRVYMYSIGQRFTYAKTWKICTMKSAFRIMFSNLWIFVWMSFVSSLVANDTHTHIRFTFEVAACTATSSFSVFAFAGFIVFPVSAVACGFFLFFSPSRSLNQID